MARVKVELDLLANLSHRMGIQYVDKKTRKSVEQFKKFVFDNLPSYCNFYKHQGCNESECRLLLGNNAARNQEEASKLGSRIKKYHGDAWEILDVKRAGNKSLVVDKSGVHDQIDSKIVDYVHSSGNKDGATKTLEKNLNENQLSLTTNPTLVHIDDEGQNNAATLLASTIYDRQQLNGTRGGVVLIGKSGHPLAINATVDLALDLVSAKVVADGVQYDARGDETVECLVDNMTQQGATSTLRWANIADEEEEQVTSPPMQKKLSPTTPAFVPSSTKLVTPQQGLSSSTNVVAILSDHLVSSNIEKLVSLTPINTDKQLQVGGSSTLPPNKFANLDDEDISEEGEEEEEEEEMLYYCFANATRNGNMFPRQQRNNKMKQERKHSWDGKVTKEFVPWHLLMRLAKQNHMTVATTSTRSNKAKK
ncbi:hypothetical protein KY289_007893 [Solanum tuberosum]|nr:hypothetical protein KY289_007893 [Solanum tuberosum]